MITLCLVIAALILFILASFGVGSPKFNLTPAGLACLTLALLIAHNGKF